MSRPLLGMIAILALLAFACTSAVALAPSPTPPGTRPPTPLPPVTIYTGPLATDPTLPQPTPPPTPTLVPARYITADRLYQLADFSSTAVWSPDGSTLLLRASSSLWTVRPDGTPLHHVVDSAASITPSVWSSDGKSIIYVNRSDSSSQEIRAVSAGGGADRKISTMDAQPRVTQGPNAPPLPLISLPGNRIAYWRDGQLLTLELDTLHEEPFLVRLSSSQVASSLRVSADGRSLAWIEDQTIMVLRNGERAPRPIAAAVSYDDYALSPDGTRLAFIDLDGESSALWVADLRSGEKRLLTRAIGGWRYLHHPSWSPDGRMIVLYRVGTGNYAVLSAQPWLVDAFDGYAWPLLRDRGSGYNPIWSPDGSRIVFSRMTPAAGETIPTGRLLNIPWVATLRPVR